MSSSNLPLILQIQADAMDDSVSITSLLRKTKAAAIKLGVEDQLPWLAHELEGYTNIDDLPEYRKIRGVLKARNPFHGLIPFFIQDSELAEALSLAPTTQPIAELESLLSDPSSTSMHFQLPQGRLNILLSIMEVRMEPVLTVSSAALVGILSAVKNLVLDWSLEMEKSGIIGENMSFSQKERENATSITHQFNIQNVGVLGDLREHSSATINQNALAEADLKSIQQIMEQLFSQLSSFPASAQEELRPLIKEVQKEIQEASPSTEIIKRSLKSVCNYPVK